MVLYLAKKICDFSSQNRWLLTSGSGVQIPSGPHSKAERKHGFEYERLRSRVDRASRNLSKHQLEELRKTLRENYERSSINIGNAHRPVHARTAIIPIQFKSSASGVPDKHPVLWHILPTLIDP